MMSPTPSSPPTAAATAPSTASTPTSTTSTSPWHNESSYRTRRRARRTPCRVPEVWPPGRSCRLPPIWECTCTLERGAPLRPFPRLPTGSTRPWTSDGIVTSQMIAFGGWNCVRPWCPNYCGSAALLIFDYVPERAEAVAARRCRAPVRCCRYLGH